MIGHRAFSGFFLVLLQGTPAVAEEFSLAVVPKNVNNPFFDPVRDGCHEVASLISQQKSSDKVTCLYIGPTSQNATEQAIIIDNLIAQNVSGIAVAVIDETITGAAINRAMDAGIPVVTFDSDAPDSKRITSIGTNDFAFGGNFAWLLSVSEPAGGRFAVISANSPNTNKRVDGLRFTMQQSFPGSKWLEFGDATDCNDDVDLALEQAYELGGNPEVDAIVAVGGWPMFAGKVKFAEFAKQHGHLKLFIADSLPFQIELLREGHGDAIVGQLPAEMGQRSIDILFSLATSQIDAPPERILTGHQVFQKETLRATGTQLASATTTTFGSTWLHLPLFLFAYVFVA